MLSAENFVPVGNRVLVKREKAPEYVGMVVVPDAVKEKQRGNLCEVVAVGPGRATDRGLVVPMSVAVGDEVVVAEWGGAEFGEGNEEYLVVLDEEILAVVER